ncbi:MAG: hypothetical protein JWO82_1383, partial [Akkermansiaceae bacterium]|nr:hypothetical protein [Akkermansiaceae bacterium]
MIEFRPLRSRVFWFGFLVVAALAWCWLDSTEYRTAEAIPFSSVRYSISSSFSAVHLASLETKAGGPAKAISSGGFTRAPLSSSASLEEPRILP